LRDELKIPCELDAGGKRFDGGRPVATIEFLNMHVGIRP